MITNIREYLIQLAQQFFLLFVAVVLLIATIPMPQDIAQKARYIRT